MACLKIAYSSRREAETQAAQCRGGQRPYLCSYCGFFHLTILNRRELKNKRKHGRVKLHPLKPGLVERVLPEALEQRDDHDEQNQHADLDHQHP